ncbi:hypothetical protein, partial [Pseudoflavonifractor phocaeensis]|uniref:hypothetical protein n=1 Tax=Pseudoflavonifractor phocaeensis TaxID=1870988 RepID=UPI00195A5525
MSSSQYQPKRVRRDRKRNRPSPLPLLASALVVCLALILIPALGRTPDSSSGAAVPPSSPP